VPRRLTLILLAGALLAGPATAHATPPSLMEGGGVKARREAVQALQRAKAALTGHGVKTGFEVTPLLKELVVRLESLHGRDHAEARRLLERPTDGVDDPAGSGYSVPEHAPYCTPHFCIHWVDTTADAPPGASPSVVPAYVTTMAGVFENVYQVENVQMGWRAPVSDDTRGGDLNKVDVYIKDVGGDGIFGYSTPDPGQSSNSQASYLVMDNDYSHAQFSRYNSYLEPMEVTAAHEYNHVLQFGYDVLQDTWTFEASAVWMEDKVYTDVNDYVSYMGPWAQMSQVPLTRFNSADPNDGHNIKVYGDAVWNRWLDTHYGQDTIRSIWEHSLSTNPPSFGPAAYQAALLPRGTNFFDAFTRFAADTAEWHSSQSPFAEGDTWPDVQRQGTLTAGAAGINGSLDHTAYALLNVTPTSVARIKLIGSLPGGTAGAVALIGRQGPDSTGSLDVEMNRLPNGGRTAVTLDGPGRFSRITAALINADTSQDGFSQATGDWDFTKDGQGTGARISTDFTPPSVAKRSPGVGKRGVARKSSVVVSFSEGVAGVSTRSLKLIGPGGRAVSARVKYDRTRRRAVLTPKSALKGRARYKVSLGSAIMDGGDNQLPVKQRSWSFTTGSR